MARSYWWVVELKFASGRVKRQAITKAANVIIAEEKYDKTLTPEQKIGMYVAGRPADDLKASVALSLERF